MEYNNILRAELGLLTAPELNTNILNRANTIEPNKGNVTTECKILQPKYMKHAKGEKVFAFCPQNPAFAYIIKM